MPSRSALKQFYIQALKENQQFFEQNLTGPLRASAMSNGPLSISTNDRLQFIVSLLKPASVTGTSRLNNTGAFGFDDNDASLQVAGDDPAAVATVVTAVWIVAIAYTYAVVVATAVVAISVVTSLAIWGSGGNETNQARMPSSNETVGNALDSHAQLVQNMNRIATLASLHGRRDLAIFHLIASVKLDVDAIVEAAEQLNLISIPPQNKKLIVTQLHQLTLDSLGIDRNFR